ncbi:MAG: hypothetical protein ACRDQ4_02905 [Pseudonocardiaceae bacterium]
MDLVVQADLMPDVGEDSLLAPATDADEVGLREIGDHGEQVISPTASRGDLKITRAWPGHPVADSRHEVPLT